MSQQVVFARAFAQLVWLLVYRPGATDEQKQALRAALIEVRDEGFVLSLAELNRAIASASSLAPSPHELPWLSELTARMAGHSVGLLDFAHGAKAADVLGVARVLASSPIQGDEGMTCDARLSGLQLTTVTVRLGRAGFVRRATPIATTRVGPAGPTGPARTPGLGIVAIEGPPASPRGRDLGIGAPTPSAGMLHVASSRDAAPRTAAPSGAAPSGAAPSGRGMDAEEQDRMVEAAFTRAGQPQGLDELLRRLDGELDGHTAPIVLDDLTRASEDLARDGLWVGVADVLARLVAREERLTDGDLKRAFLIHLRRLFKPGVLRGLAQLLAKRRELRSQVEPIFVRAGEVGADVLLELLVSSNLASERRAYRTALVRCPSAVEPLVHLLQDPRWYVVRNAAELLGEMGAQHADAKLVAALRHGDARVRRSAAGALARLGTTRGTFALQPLLGDSNAAVRLQAVHGIASARLPRSVPALLQALEREGDPDIQHALLAALGSHPTDDAIERLAQAAHPGSLLHRKPTPFRLAAISALGDAATPAAMAALRAMQGDRDREVRAAVDRTLAGLAQGVGANR